ncbi:hypothetical protein E5288_WYG008096 [Bos mutus]|uniref:Uncharacterized protein n=1 Tax=Bos mutus TaxID=72004 RepID=A0A6B0RV06_9CETA|nr:hypothetical protein [Bos mutus]
MVNEFTEDYRLKNLNNLKVERVFAFGAAVTPMLQMGIRELEYSSKHRMVEDAAFRTGLELRQFSRLQNGDYKRTTEDVDQDTSQTVFLLVEPTVRQWDPWTAFQGQSVIVSSVPRLPGPTLHPPPSLKWYFTDTVWSNEYSDQRNTKAVGSASARTGNSVISKAIISETSDEKATCVDPMVYRDLCSMVRCEFISACTELQHQKRWCFTLTCSILTPLLVSPIVMRKSGTENLDDSRESSGP